MKVNGSHVLHADRQQVWDALQDPAVLVRTIPGCQELAAVGDDAYTAVVQAGIASIKGTYDGRVELSDQDEPHSYTLRATGSGGPGTIDATAKVSLHADDGATRVEYDAHAIIGGAIAGVGQRVVSGVAKRNARTFFDAVDDYLAGRLDDGAAATHAVAATTPAEQVGAPLVGADGAAVAAGAAGPAAQVFRAPSAAPGPSAGTPDAVPLLLAALAGAVVALLGVLVGQRRRG